MHSYFREMEQKLESFRREYRLREVRIPAGKDFSSNDYLCLTNNCQLTAWLKEGIDLYGAGSGSSRLIRGHREAFAAAESAFARWTGAEAALFVSSGYLANTGLMSSFGADSVFFTDRLNHASILDGIRLSGGQKIYYRHLDMNDLESRLKKPSRHKKIIVSETLFSMDGDMINPEDLKYLRDKYQCILVLDEAHALGVYGETGAGVCEGLDVADYRIFTLGKAFAVEGAFVVSTQTAISYLLNTMRTFIFSTAPLPAIAHAVLPLIEKIAAMKNERTMVLENSAYFRNALKKAGFDTGTSVSHIIPVMLNDPETALGLAQKLEQHGFDIRAIRPPTVKQSRLRTSIHSCHSREDITSLINTLESVA